LELFDYEYQQNEQFPITSNKWMQKDHHIWCWKYKSLMETGAYI